MALPQPATSPIPCPPPPEGCGAASDEPCVYRPTQAMAGKFPELIGKARTNLHANRREAAQRTRAEQPAPVANGHTPIVDLVVADMQARKEHGIATYGMPLQPFNGRNAAGDAYDEALDLAFYLRQHIEEQRTLAPLLAELIRAARAACLDPEVPGYPKSIARLGEAIGRYAQAHEKTGLPPIPDANEGYVHRSTSDGA